jgi:HlyD family secretion protein
MVPRWVFHGGLLLVVAVLPGSLLLLPRAFDLRSDLPLESVAVNRDDLRVTFSGEGHLISSNNLELKCELSGGSAILWLVDEGKQVQAGELLALLDSSSLTEQITQQQIATVRARSEWVQAENNVQVAELAVQEYLQGTYAQQREALATQLTIAKENQRRAEDALSHIMQMFRRGFVDPLKLESQQFAVRRSRLEMESARTALEVMDKFTKKKALLELRSQAETARANVAASAAAYELEKLQLELLESQVAKCRICAPHDGTVVYANEFTKGPRPKPGQSLQQSVEIETGATVREQQDILWMPDVSQMETRVRVHESRAYKLKPGMPARIRVNNHDFAGAVSEIDNQPRPARPGSYTVEYDVVVSVQDDTTGLKPRMTADVEILIAKHDNVLTVPVSAVVEQRSKFYCWVTDSAKVERRALRLGLCDGKLVEVHDGVAEGEEVVLRPRDTVASAREQADEPQSVEQGLSAFRS